MYRPPLDGNWYATGQGSKINFTRLRPHWGTTGGAPHPKFPSGMGPRVTPRAWAGYGGSETITAEEEGLLGSRVWATSSAEEAAAAADTAIVTGEDAAIMTTIGEGEVISVEGGIIGIIAGALFGMTALAEYYVTKKYTTEDDWALSSDKKKRSPDTVLEGPSPKKPKTSLHPGWTGTTNAKRHLNFGSHNPLSSPDPKKNKPSPRDKTHPVQPPSGDFSGLVSTFINPVTNRIIGYKGIPRKHRYTSLHETSEFWRRQMMRPIQELSVAS